MSVVSEIRQHNSGKFYRDEFRNDKSWNGNEHNVLLRGQRSSNGELDFADTAMATGADDVTDARGLAVADFDNDGDLDIVINTHPGDCGRDSVAPVLLDNELGHHRNWLAVQLTGTNTNRDAIGAQVTIQLAPSDDDGQPTTLLRLLSAGGGYASQNSDRLYFGLGTAQEIATLTVQWPSGLTQSIQNLDVNRVIHWIEGENEPVVRPLPQMETAATEPQ